jgi:hypothetical protein
LTRNRFRDVTPEELAHIEQARPDVFAALKFAAPVHVSKRTMRRLEAAAKNSEAPVTKRRKLQEDAKQKAAAPKKAAKKAAKKSSKKKATSKRKSK